MYHRSFDLIVVVAITIVTVGLALTGVSNGMVRVMLGLPLVLVLPGYALNAAMFPRDTMGVPERIVFSLGLSFAVAVLGGFVLNWTPWGLQAASWAVLLGSVSLGASCVALARRWTNTGEETIAIPSNLKINLNHALFFGAALLVTAVAISIARTGATRQSDQGFTQLWVLPANEVNQSAVRVGVRSGESAVVRYRLQVEAEGNVVLDWPSIELDPGESWERTVMLPAEQADTRTVEAKIYRLDTPTEIYRRVVLWSDF